MKKEHKLIDVEAESRKLLPKEIVDFIQQSQKDDAHPESQLIAVLHKVQGHFGYLDQKHLEAISQLMHIPAAKISGVASFYHYFQLEPRGKWVISVCTGTACYVRGAEALAKKLKEELGIEFGETTKDGLFTLEQTRCLGTCALSPVVKIGDDIHPRMTPDQIPALIASYIAKKT
jgi:NADH:ubiquinone oxidoreductase subunit E